MARSCSFVLSSMEAGAIPPPDIRAVQMFDVSIELTPALIEALS